MLARNEKSWSQLATDIEDNRNNIRSSQRTIGLTPCKLRKHAHSISSKSFGKLDHALQTFQTAPLTKPLVASNSRIQLHMPFSLADLSKSSSAAARPASSNVRHRASHAVLGLASDKDMLSLQARDARISTKSLLKGIESASLANRDSANNHIQQHCILWNNSSLLRLNRTGIDKNSNTNSKRRFVTMKMLLKQLPEVSSQPQQSYTSFLKKIKPPAVLP